MTDRYIKAILTVIAMELLWLGVKDIGTPVAAQAIAVPTPVIIRGIDIRPERTANAANALPTYQIETVNISAIRPIPIVGNVPLRISVDQPIPVVNVGYTPGAKPGE